jgi:hypothetical protein
MTMEIQRMEVKSKLVANFIKIKNVSVLQLLEMHKIFIQYYHNADLNNFVNDMGAKTGVIVLEDKIEKRIVGFSTWTELELVASGKKSIGIFSGDTVIEKKYWGNKALQTCFVTQLLKTKLKKPKTPIFWLLISKGYKTYLLLTNNFPKHYPSHDKNNIRLEAVVDEYCQKLYPSAYNETHRLLDFGGEYQHLKDDVAAITKDMTEGHPDIRHFEMLNPSWRQGTELPCVGEVSVNMVWQFMKKNVLSFKKPKSTTLRLEAS